MQWLSLFPAAGNLFGLTPNVSQKSEYRDKSRQNVAYCDKSRHILAVAKCTGKSVECDFNL